ncbi:MAG: MFS transporter [Candidatus Hodarchaeota archaeon]
MANKNTASTKNVLLWSMYDLANTIFSMGIVSLTVVKFFTLLGMKQGLEWNIAFMLAQGASAISTIIVAITVPFMGALSDRSGTRKPWVLALGLLCILFTGLVFFLPFFWIAFFLFMVANITYQYGNLFYDSQIPHISSKNDMGRVSAIGVAIGYFGSFIALALSMIVLPLLVGGHTLVDEAGNLQDPVTLAAVPPDQIVLGDFHWMWLACAVAFFVTMIPYFFSWERTQRREAALSQIFREAGAELVATIKDVVRYRDALLFYIGWVLTVDVVNTIIVNMLPAAEDAFGMATSKVFGLPEPQVVLLVGVCAAVFLTYFIGPAIDKRGPKLAFGIIGVAYLTALTIAMVADVSAPGIFGPLSHILIYIMAILVGGAMGSTWVAGRQMVIELAPEEKVGQYFGFQKFCGKGVSAIGAGVFGLVVAISFTLFGSVPLSYRFGFLSLALIYLAGLFFLMLVKSYHQRFLAGERAPYE